MARSSGQRCRAGLGIASVLAMIGGPAAAQQAVRAHTVGDPQPGSQAPAFVLPYVRAEGPGPVDQPFILRAELGRVVVLAIVPDPADSGAAVLLRTLATNYQLLFPGDVVVAAAIPWSSRPSEVLARELGLTYKVLADSADQVRRLFGVDRRDLAVYVINPSGRVSWRNTRFRPMESTSYDAVRVAVMAAWDTPAGW